MRAALGVAFGNKGTDGDVVLLNIRLATALGWPWGSLSKC